MTGRINTLVEALQLPRDNAFWATSVESQHPRKLCIALVQIVLQVASNHGVVLRPRSLHDLAGHPLLFASNLS